MADISTIKPSERTVEIMHPGTGQALGVRVRVMSIEDDRLKKIKREITDERFKLESKNKSLKSDDVERNGNRLLFAATTGWEWYNPTGNEADMPDFHGEQPDYTQRNFMAVINELPWFADQIREEIDETKAFFDTSKQG